MRRSNARYSQTRKTNKASARCTSSSCPRPIPKLATRSMRGRCLNTVSVTGVNRVQVDEFARPFVFLRLLDSWPRLAVSMRRCSSWSRRGGRQRIRSEYASRPGEISAPCWLVLRAFPAGTAEGAKQRMEAALLKEVREEKKHRHGGLELEIGEEEPLSLSRP